MTTQFNRSEVLSFFDLTEDQQKDMVSAYDTELAQESQYVTLGTQALPLFMFMNQKAGLWDGVYGTSYFSAYFIKLSRCGSMAVVAERYW
jgi:hypothetical protein